MERKPTYAELIAAGVPSEEVRRLLIRKKGKHPISQSFKGTIFSEREFNSVIRDWSEEIRKTVKLMKFPIKFEMAVEGEGA